MYSVIALQTTVCVKQESTIAEGVNQ